MESYGLLAMEVIGVAVVFQGLCLMGGTANAH